MRILITGHNGFIGRNMVMALQEHDLIFYEPGDADYSLNEVDRVIHLGAITQTTCTDWKSLVKYNYQFSIDLIERCQNRRIPLQIASSAAVYGVQNITFREEDICRPANLYAESKVMVEQYVDRIKLKAPVQLFRYFNVYGPYEDHKGEQASPFHKFRQQAKEGKIKVFQNSERFRRDFIPVEKVIDLHKQFFDIEESGVWNFGTGTATSFFEVAQTIADETDAKIIEIPMPEMLLKSYQKYTKADLSKLHKTLLQSKN